MSVAPARYHWYLRCFVKCSAVNIPPHPIIRCFRQFLRKHRARKLLLALVISALHVACFLFSFLSRCCSARLRGRGLTFTSCRVAQDKARSRPLNLLFQVIKRSKTRGDVKMTLRVGPTSLDRVDGERLQHRVSSLPLLSVEKVYLFTDDATQVRTARRFLARTVLRWRHFGLLDD